MGPYVNFGVKFNLNFDANSGVKFGANLVVDFGMEPGAGPAVNRVGFKCVS